MSNASITAPAPTTETTGAQSQDEASRTLLDLLTTEKMDGSDDSAVAAATTTALTGSDSSSQGQLGRWGTLKQRLGLNAIICCSGGWDHHNRSYSDALLPAVHEEYDDPEADEDHTRPFTPDDHNEEATTNIAETVGVNLATALAEERQSRLLATTVEVETENEIFGSVPKTPTSAKVSLMRLMAEATVEEDEVGGGAMGSCCVCMERKKGAAFIPCGHTFCRVCSRELWLNRGSCPLCNRSILDVLDIF